MPATISVLLPRTRDIFHGLPNPYDLAKGEKYQIMDNLIAVFNIKTYFISWSVVDNLDYMITAT